MRARAKDSPHACKPHAGASRGIENLLGFGRGGQDDSAAFSLADPRGKSKRGSLCIAADEARSTIQPREEAMKCVAQYADAGMTHRRIALRYPRRLAKSFLRPRHCAPPARLATGGWAVIGGDESARPSTKAWRGYLSFAVQREGQRVCLTSLGSGWMGSIFLSTGIQLVLPSTTRASLDPPVAFRDESAAPNT